MKINEKSCPNCETINLFPFEEAESCTVCSSCRTVYNSNGDLLKKEYLEAQTDLFLLPLGTKFREENETYTVTGYVIKKEQFDAQAIWVEYFLTHESLPNLYLSYYNGHWTLLRFLPDLQWEKGSIHNRYNIAYKGISYELYHYYNIQILDAQGSFNFPFYEDDNNMVREFINWNEVFIWEENKRDKFINFYIGRYIFSSELAKQIEPKIKLPKRVGYASYQPFYFPFDIKSFRLMSILLIGVMVLCMFSWQAFFSPKYIKEGQFELNSAENTAVTSSPFEVKYDNSVLHVKASVFGLSNDWVYADLALINTKTGEERYFSMEAEYYYGYEGGESWSEGSNTESGNLQYVDAGTYVLEATPTQALGSNEKTIRFELVSQKGSWSIFWTLTLFIVVINLFFALLQDYFNHKKQGEDYDTFSSNE